MKKIIIFNVIAVIAILVGCEIYFYNNFYTNKNSPRTEQTIFLSTEGVLRHLGLLVPERYKEPPSKPDKKPILLLGCSYTYGQYLDIEDTLGGKLSKLTGRWVYNFGLIAHDHVTAGMLIDQEAQKRRLKYDPEYIIYTYMFHHMVRTSKPVYYNWLRQKGYLPGQKFNPLYYLNTYKYFKDIQLDKAMFYDRNFGIQKAVFLNVLEGMKKTTEKIYPNSKFVVLIYSDVLYDLCPHIWYSVDDDKTRMENLFAILEDEDFKKRIEQKGITVITTKELIGRKMNSYKDRVQNDPNRPHPSAEAWELIVPKLVEKLELNKGI